MQNKRAEAYFQVSPQGLIFWHYLLREGVDIEISPGNSVQELLHKELNIPEQTIQKQIKTIFLNQNPVDDLQITVPDQSTLTLSGAMPGFLGACMRVNSPYAKMRESLSGTAYSNSKGSVNSNTIIVRLKIFNVLVPEIGPLVLQKGILLSREKFQDHLENLPANFYKSSQQVKINQHPCLADTYAILKRLEDSPYLRIVLETV